jgi:hypothetical protein
MTTMSMFICNECETPFSTVKAWLTVPENHRAVSERMRSVETMMRAIVHELPVRVRVRYVGFVLAVQVRFYILENVFKAYGKRQMS